MLNKYADFAHVFLLKFAAKLLKHGINDYVIDLVDDWQPPYGLIYSLEPVELEILKAYIENNLANGFIRSSKSSTISPIFFDKKPYSSL